MSAPQMERRTFIKTAISSIALVTGIRLSRFGKRSAVASEDGEHSWAMVIDRSKCKGCGYCTLACRAHNNVPPWISWNQLIDVTNASEKPSFVPRPCMHCEHAPCKEVCMVGATYQRPDGIVMMDYDRCIGCRYCEVACPYLARAFNWKSFEGPNPAVPEWGQPEVPRRPRGVVEKCSFCFQRIDRGLALGLTPGVDPVATPACVVVCPVGARTFGDLKDPESEVSKLLIDHAYCQLRDDLGTGPRVYYLNLDQGEEKA